nr:MAG TPA: hypothetical protein [Caudoviricetes sp.]
MYLAYNATLQNLTRKGTHLWKVRTSSKSTPSSTPGLTTKPKTASL